MIELEYKELNKNKKINKYSYYLSFLFLILKLMDFSITFYATRFTNSIELNPLFYGKPTNIQFIFMFFNCTIPPILLLFCIYILDKLKMNSKLFIFVILGLNIFYTIVFIWNLLQII